MKLRPPPSVITPAIKDYAQAIDYKESQRAPDVFMPYQQRWVADDADVKVIEKGRRIGISWAEAADAVLTAAAGYYAGGMDVWYVGYNKDMAVEFILDAAQWARHFNEAISDFECNEEIFQQDDEKKSVLTFSIKFASGNRITALSSAPANLRGKQGLVIIDEAAFHPDLKELLKAAFALLIWGGKVHIISTHKGIDNAFNELIEDIRADKKPYSLHRVTFDDAIQEGLYERICLRLKKNWSLQGQREWIAKIRAIYHPNDAEELDCIPSQSTGSYFSRALIESRMSADYPVFRLSLPDNFEQKPAQDRWEHVQNWLEDNLLPIIKALPQSYSSYYGMDFARNLDLSVIWPLLEQTNLKHYTPFTVELRNVPFEQQKQVLHFNCDNLPNFRGGANDTRGNGQWLGEVTAQKYGFERILRVMITQEWYREAMPPYKAAFDDAEILIPKDSYILDDHRAVKLVGGVARVPDGAKTKDVTGKRHGDSAIAGCLALYAVKHCAFEFDFESDGERQEIKEYESYRNHG